MDHLVREEFCEETGLLQSYFVAVYPRNSSTYPRRIRCGPSNVASIFGKLHGVDLGEIDLDRNYAFCIRAYQFLC